MEKKSAKSKLKCAGTPKAFPKRVQKASPKVQKRVANRAQPETGKRIRVLW